MSEDRNDLGTFHTLFATSAAMFGVVAASVLFARRRERQQKCTRKSVEDMNEQINELLKEILEIDDLSSERLEKLKTCDYLIVLDMGCGSTSAGVLNLKLYRSNIEKGIMNHIHSVSWDYKRFSTVSYKAVKNELTAQLSIPTIIGYRDLKPIIGPEALATGNAAENFKALPSKRELDREKLTITTRRQSITRTLREIWPDYFDGLMDLICLNCSQHDSVGPTNRHEMANNTLLMVAHPADARWSEPNTNILKNYRDIIAQGTQLPDENILTISEAKAAMQYIRRKKAGQFNFNRGVVIIDIGASTIDIEYLSSGLDKPIEYSLTMAGREVDALLLHFALVKLFPAQMEECPRPDQLPKEDFFLNTLSSRSAEVKFNAREAKERISKLAREGFPNMSVKFNVGPERIIEITADVLCGLLGNQDKAKNPITGAVYGDWSFPADYDLRIANYIRKQKSLTGNAQEITDTWYGHLENLICYVMDDLRERGYEASQVIVTGGSCQLPGIEDHVFNAIHRSNMGDVICTKDQIAPMDDEYDYENSVPFGGCFYVGGLLGKLDVLQQFPQKLYDTLSSELLNIAAKEITAEVNAQVREITLKTLKWWKELPNKSDDSSTNALNRKLRSECDLMFTQTSLLDNTVERAINKISPEKHLCGTLKAVEELLDTLAGTKFTGKVPTDLVKLDLPVKSVSNAVRMVDPDTLHLGFWQSINGTLQKLWNGVKNLFGAGVTKDNIQWNKEYRGKIYEAYSKDVSNAVSPKLRSEISSELEKEFLKTGVFGIPSQIISKLSQDIMQALYMN